MTRINTLPPSELHDLHLLAEYREIGRICRLAYNAEVKGYTPTTYGIPENYTLGKGHMKFFSNKLGYIHTRFELLVKELKIRGYKLSFTDLKGLPHPVGKDWYEDWIPSVEDVELCRGRILEKIAEKPWLYGGN